MERAAACRGLVLALIAAAALLAPNAGAATLPEGFQETVVFDGLTDPTAVEFSPDGRVFVAEKSGRILIYSGLADSSPALFADLSTNVHNYWDRGLLSLALDPGFPGAPYLYVLYTHDAEIGGEAPLWGTAGVLGDPCPSPGGPLGDGCVVSGRLSRLQVDGDAMTGPEQVLVEDWCQQYPSHSIGDIQFDGDGALYVSAGDGASFTFADYGQQDNPCDDPTEEGGSLRSLDLRTRSDPNGLDGTIIRVDRATGAPLPTNPLFLDPDENARRIVAYGFRNPFRFAVRPGTSELWIGDVGWDTLEEVNRLSLPAVGMPNFGWPCYEGPAPEDQYDALDLRLCEELYAHPGSATPPVFAYGPGSGNFPSGCYEGGKTVSGLAFYGGSTYPGYSGALFLADYSRNCIWLMRPGADGSPDPDRREVFATQAPSPVELETGPGGDLYYVDFHGGSVRRIRNLAGNSPPTAVATASPASGPAPLTVRLDASGSSDPDAEALTYAWDLDGDGEFDDSAEPVVSWMYPRRGRYEPRVRVTDSLGESSTAFVAVNVDNTPPVAAIETPQAGSIWKVGAEVGFSGSGVDHDDGALPASALGWRLLLEHCSPGCHKHVVQTWDGVAGGSFAAPDHEYPSYLELELTATDSDGTAHTVVRRLDPQLVQLVFATDPVGLELIFGTHRQAAPFARTVIVGSRTTLTAPSPQSSGGREFQFSAWSTGGARSHMITAPAESAGYTAAFVELVQPQPPPSPPSPPPSPQPQPPPSRTPTAAHCAVPRLSGLTIAGARRMLQAGRCRLGQVSWVYSRTRRGRVRTQSPRAGRRLPNLARVAVVVSRGPRARPR